ncbi:MAG TPA: helix-turn-helix transcriptional regulator [Jiangellaceae bacterium]|nr:helix-turn-helix transcriptional regulator [Jiangellaceae bacterium]
MGDEHDGSADAAQLAATMLRALRARAQLSQRELAAKAGVARSTIARAESGAAPPSWAVMTRVVEAAGCRLQLVAEDGTPVEPWPFDDVLDRGARHLPAHLEVWRVGRRGWWWGYYRYSTWAYPPTPTHTYQMRSTWRDDGPDRPDVSGSDEDRTV